MTRESEVAQLLRDDPTLMALLPGGVYTDEELGVEGIRRDSGSPSAAAFDASGFLRTCAVVRQDALTPFPGVRSIKDKITGTMQMVYVFFYERRGHTEIDAAKQRSYEVLEGARLSDSYQIWWDFDSATYPDMGPVANSTALRQDWVIVGMRRPS